MIFRCVRGPHCICSLRGGCLDCSYLLVPVNYERRTDQEVQTSVGDPESHVGLLDPTVVLSLILQGTSLVPHLAMPPVGYKATPHLLLSACVFCPSK